jgi:hypothetical protein
MTRLRFHSRVVAPQNRTFFDRVVALCKELGVDLSGELPPLLDTTGGKDVGQRSRNVEGIPLCHS